MSAKSETTTLSLVEKAMDEIAREFGIMRRDDPNRASLLGELSALRQLRMWIKSEGNRTLTQPMDELAHELTILQMSNRVRIQIIAEIISKSHSLNEH